LVCGPSKTPFSKKTSISSGDISPLSRSSFSLGSWLLTTSLVASSAVDPLGTEWAPRKLTTISMGVLDCAVCSTFVVREGGGMEVVRKSVCQIRRSLTFNNFISLGVSRPYPLLHSTSVVPDFNILFSRGSRRPSSSSSSLWRV